MPLPANTQMTLDFQPGLPERFPCLLDCVRHGAYTHRNPLKTIAADMDMSQSQLSRKLADKSDSDGSGNSDPRRLSVDDLEKYLVATGDMAPIHYLVEKYLVNQEAAQRRAVNALVQQMPEILALLKAAAATPA